MCNPIFHILISDFMRKYFILIACLTLGISLSAQSAKPKDMWEVGLQGGTMFISGDLESDFGYAAGIHFRKSLDHVFSLRGDFWYGNTSGSKAAIGPVNWSSETEWMSGSLMGVMSLNSINFDRPVRRTNLYVMAGVGANRFTTDYLEPNGAIDLRGIRVMQTVDPEFAPHAAFGAGISFRLSPKINLGLEAQAFSLFGTRTDRVDGYTLDTDRNNRSSFGDVPTIVNATVNFNLGNIANASEPLYWVNPLDNVMNDIQEIKNRPEISLEDSDGDGVIDALDQENNTPAGAIVDVKGRTLDSDRDGVPDHLDQEPFYTPRADEEVNSDGVAINPATGQPASRAGGGVSEERVNELIQQALQNYQPVSGSDGRSNTAEWFLPMIHFSSDSYRIKYSDYGNLASIARTMNSNQDLRLVVIGFTDATGSETINNNLSYQRAKSIIEHLEQQHGVARSRMVLQWKGSEDNLVPATSSYMNRRVEFRVAGPGDFEMSAPASLDGDGY
jgi:outer membrane protein OmpA-like peptidoglycan-associated protein/opacity protein-like surface antigen